MQRKKSNHLKLFSMLILAFSLIVGAQNNSFRVFRSGASTFNITLNSTNKPSLVDGHGVALYRYTDFQYSRASEAPIGHVVLEKTGLMTNVTPITGLTSIRVIFETFNDSVLTLYYGNNELPITDSSVLTSNSLFTFPSQSRFILLQADNDSVRIDDIIIDYTCVGESIDVVLPKVYIQTEIVGGSHLPINSLKQYTSGTFSINGSDFLSGGIRLRGNSTSTKPKKPYRIKLDTSTAFFGLRKAKNWVLLAEYMDGSSLHNYSAFDYAKKLNTFSFVNTMNYVEVYLNGSYNGLYLFSEHQDVKKGRVDIEYEDAITTATSLSEIGFFIELDGRLPSDPNEIFGETFFSIPVSETTTHHYALKYPEKEDFENEEYFYSFFAYVENYILEIIDAFKTGTREEVNSLVDLDSLLAFALVDLVFNEKDHVWTSFKLHKKQNSDKLVFGPIWDYDSQVYNLPFLNAPVPNPFDSITSTTYTRFSPSNLYFLNYINRLGGLSDFESLYAAEGSNILGELRDDILQNILPEISLQLILDANRWYSKDLGMVFENIKWVIRYLEERKVYLDNRFL